MNNFIIRIYGALPVIAAVFGLATGFDADAQVSGYLKDQRGTVVKSGAGLCWRTGSWTPSMATEECDPDLVPRKKPQTAATPVVAPPARPGVAPAQTTPSQKPAARPAPVSEKVTLSADAMFDFDKSAVRADGKGKLDELAGRIKGVNVDTIIAVGHSDRFGSVAYNLKLSQRRAESVKAYLVSKGVPANRIYTEGKGKSQPKTRPGQCKGPKSPKVVACLQADRRVELEIIGSRAK